MRISQLASTVQDCGRLCCFCEREVTGIALRGQPSLRPAAAGGLRGPSDWWHWKLGDVSMSVDLFPSVTELTLKLMTWMAGNRSTLTALQLEPQILSMSAGSCGNWPRPASPHSSAVPSAGPLHLAPLEP